MADAIVSALLEQLTTTVIQEVKQEVRLVVGVRKEADKMTRTFQTIQAVMEDAENRHFKENAVKDWLDELKHISYDIDDVLDEWNTALLRSKNETDQSLIKTHPILSLLGKVRSCIPSPCSCFGEVALRHDIARKIKELNERLQAIAEKRERFGFRVDQARNNNDLATERPKTTYFVDESEVHGRDQDKHTLISLLLSENNPGEKGIPIISIVGMGGIGKTTLAQTVYIHEELSAYFQKKIWVCVSDPFDEVRIAKAILEALTGSASDLNELTSVLEKIQESIERQRYLLVLDDVWIKDEGKWQSLKSCLNCGPKGSKILVTTRNQKVAAIMGCKKLINLGELSPKHCWSLFSQIAFSEKNETQRESLEDIGENIVARCQGLPLALKTLGSLLRFKRTREEWQRISDSPMWELDDDEVEKGIFSPLLLSYYDLSPPLRQCFSYCAIFPKDHEIEKDMLIKLWLAQGFLGDKMEIRGEEYFDELARRSFFQEFKKDEDDDSMVIGCKMHDIVHDFAQFLTKRECVLAEINGCNGVTKGVESSHKDVRHLTLENPPSSFDYVSLLHPFKKLRSFLVLNCNFFDVSLPKLFHQLINLRMLSLLKNYSRGGLSKIPKEIGELIHLRYLSLEENRELIELPEALCDLCNLQTLNIRWCMNLQKLPHGMGKLINLRHLQNQYTTNLRFMPKAMERLTCLQTLEMFCVVKKGGEGIETETSFRLADLEKLIRLRGSLRIDWLGDVEEANEAPDLTNFALRKLTLNFDGGDDKEHQRKIEDEACFLQALQPPLDLQILHINSCQGPGVPFPNWMTSLTSLKSVEFNFCESWESLPPLGKLPSLESLKIFDASKVKKVGEEFVGVETSSSSSSSSVNHNSMAFFPKLKTLTFDCMPEWEEWEYENESEGDASSFSSNIPLIIMPKLQTLSIGFCIKLKMLPRHLLQKDTPLRELKIKCSHILFRRYNRRTGEEWPFISHIPIVEITG